MGKRLVIEVYRCSRYMGSSFLNGCGEQKNIYIDLAKPKSRARTFFSRTSQRLALARTRAGSSDSEPSALTTELLDKAVALACLRYS